MSGALRADLTGKVALITGGGRGIGRAIALALAKNGADVAIASRSLSDMDETKALVAARGGRCLSIPADVTNVPEISAMVEKAYAWQERLDILVNCAGMNVPKPALEFTEAEWDRVLDTNLKGTFFCCQAAARKMIPQKSGKMINITSQMAFVGYYNRAAYSASKGGVTQLTKVLAVEWAPYQINVNCVAPTFIETAFMAEQFKNEQFKQEVISRIPMGKIAQTEDVTGAVLYLASEAAGMVTGSSILVDGGWVAW